MKYAFMAQTAYQLINIIKFVYHNCEGSRGESAVFVSDRVASRVRDLAPLERAGLFRRVCVYREKKYAANRWLSKLDTALSVARKGSFGKLLRPEDRGMAPCEVVVIPSVALESQIFWQYFPHQRVYLIEDGLGSITGDIVRSMRPGRRALSRLLHGPFKLDKIYVNNLAFNRSVCDTEFCQIPGDYDDGLCRLLGDVFLPEGAGQTYRRDDVIYLQQPVWIWNRDFIPLERDLVERCRKASDDRLIVRCHPLTVRDPRIPKCRYDETNYSWEVLCATQIAEDNLLIGVFSTAQFSPRQMFDREPWVIFLYKIITPNNIDISEIAGMVERLRQTCRRPEKIIVPETTEELTAAIAAIVNRAEARP